MNEKLTVEWMEKKNPDWIVMTLVKTDGTKLTDVSVNRVNKKGEPFPNFDEIQAGRTIEGNPWQSSAGKWYLFAPKPEGAKRPNMDRIIEKKQAGIAESQARKEQSIHAAQDRSAWMWAKNNASMLVAHHPAYKFLAEETLLGRIEELATEIYNMEPNKPF